MGGVARVRMVSRKPMEVKNAMIRQELLKKTARRPAERVSLEKEMSGLDKRLERLPENKRQVVKRELLQRLEARHNTIRSNVEKINSSLSRYKFEEKNIKFLEIMRKQELKRTNKNEYQMWNFAEQKLKAGYKPAELLRAGYTVNEVTAGLYRLEIK